MMDFLGRGTGVEEFFRIAGIYPNSLTVRVDRAKILSL